MTSKINVADIVLGHYRSLKNTGEDKTSKLDVVVMFVLPAIFSLVSFKIGFKLSEDYVGTLIGAFSIFSGFLFNVIVLIYGVAPPDTSEESGLAQNQLLSQTFANISFSILICLSIILCLMFILIGNRWISAVASAFFFGLSLNFGLSLLMVLKRIFVLLGLKFPE